MHCVQNKKKKYDVNTKDLKNCISFLTLQDVIQTTIQFSDIRYTLLIII